MSNVVISLDEFYTEYAEFDTEIYKNICPAAFRQAKTFISVHNCGVLKGERRKTAIYLLTAHLSVLRLKAQSGAGATGTDTTATGLVASASVGEVSVSYQQIPATDDMFDYWLATTPYGQELLALLDMLSSIPLYIGGSLERVF